MDCGIKCIKYLIFIFNFIMLFAGLALIVAGAVIETMYKEYFSFFNGKVNYAAIFFITVGVVMFVVAFFGCCGAMRDSYGMIVMYTILLTVVCLVQIALAVSAFYMRDEVEDTLEMKMKASIPQYGENNTALYMSWNKLQTQLECCGVMDYKDWKENKGMKDNKVPDTCCIKYAKGCGSYTDIGSINSQGCKTKLMKLSEENMMLLGLLAGIFAFVQITGVVFASCLAVSLKRDYESMK